MPKEDDGSLKDTELLGTVYGLWCRTIHAQGQPHTEWEDLDEDTQAAWGHCVIEGKRLIEASEDEPTAARTLAANMQLAFQRALHATSVVEPTPWEEMPPVLQLAWEALVRHLFNMLVFDRQDGEDGDPAEHEERMAAWFETKLQEMGLTEAQQIQKREARNEA